MKTLCKLIAILFITTTSNNLIAQTAMLFDGIDDVVDCGNSPVFELTNNFTLELKVKQTEVQVFPAFAGNFRDSSDYWLGYWIGGDHSGLVTWYIGTDSTDQSGYSLYSKTSLIDGNWHHLSGTFKNDTAKLYIDGILEAQQYTPYARPYSTEKFTIGNDIFNEAFSGKLDNVRLWNKELSASEIALLKDSCLTGNENNLIAYYDFEDGSGDVLSDLTTNQNDGVLTNMDNSTAWTKGLSCISTISSINDLESFQNVSVFPNPTENIVNIDLSNFKNSRINVYNSTGQLVYESEKINSTIYQFELNETQGIYIISVISENQVQNYKLMKL